MKRALCATLVAGSVLMGGCASDPYGGGGFGGGYGNTMKGAGIGALGGAGIGALATKNHGTGAAIGAAAGALLGAGVGYYMDRQERQLREQMEGTGVEVKREGDNLKVIMPSQITFDFDSSNIKSGFYPTLNSVAQVLRENDQTTVEVTGHTDSKGTEKYNQQLSERRARAVADYLTGQGVTGSRITSRGMGESSPVASNSTDSGRAQNRRVEILVRPVAQPQPAQPAYNQPPAYGQQPPYPGQAYGQQPAYQQQPAPAYNAPAYGQPPAYQQGYTPPGYQPPPPPSQQPYYAPPGYGNPNYGY